MAGHNKWSKVKRLKGALDAKRGQLFSRLAKEIIMAAKAGGGDPARNLRLRTAVQAARDGNMPGDSIERAIKKGTGEIGGQQIEELLYEGYAPGGVALLVEAATDNKNRTAMEVRNVFSRQGGNLGGSGSVAYQFRHMGQIAVPRSAADEDRLLEIVLEAGADEYTAEEEHYVVLTPPDRLYAVAEALREAGIAPESAKLAYIPRTLVPLTDEKTTGAVLRLLDALEECDDVQNVYANFDAPEEILARAH